MAVGVEVAEVLMESTVTGGLDIVAATDGSGKRYLYGETAMEGATLPFGCIPADWSGLKVEKTVPISRVKVRTVAVN